MMDATACDDWLLIRAAADPQAARPLLDEWVACVDFESGITAISKRLLGWLVRQVNPQSLPDTLAPRIRGLGRLWWTEQQGALNQLHVVSQMLAAAGITALIPAEIVPNTLSLLWDIDYPDVYISVEAAHTAVDHLLANGWQNKDHRIPRSRYPLIEGIRLWGGDNRHITLRWRLFEGGSLASDDAVWGRVQSARLDPFDQFLWIARVAQKHPSLMVWAAADLLTLHPHGIPPARPITYEAAEVIREIDAHVPLLMPPAYADFAHRAAAKPIALNNLWARYWNQPEASIGGFLHHISQWYGIPNLPARALRRLQLFMASGRKAPHEQPARRNPADSSG
jgi:hypothetical protein